VFIKPHCPWQNSKVERLNRTLQSEWAYRQVFTSNAERAAALAPWIEYYNTRRPVTAHSAGSHHQRPVTRDVITAFTVLAQSIGARHSVHRAQRRRR